MPATPLITSHVTDLDFASREEERFNHFYEDILSLHELLEQVENISLRRQFRDIINKVEGIMSSTQIKCLYLTGYVLSKSIL